MESEQPIYTAVEDNSGINSPYDNPVDRVLMSLQRANDLQVLDLEQITIDPIDEATKIPSTDLGSTEGPRDCSRLFEQPGVGISPLSPRANGVKAKWIEYHYRYPPWPTTAKEGVLHIIDTTYLPPTIARERLHSDVEYGKEHKQARELESFYFEQITGNKVLCHVQEFQCSGVDHHEWRRLLMTVQERSLGQRPPFEGASKTEAYFEWLGKQYLLERCHVHCSGWKIKRREGSDQWIAICKNYGKETQHLAKSGHFVRGIRQPINIQYLRELASGQKVVGSYECNGVFARRSQRKTCDGYEQSRAFNTSRIRLIQVLGNSHPKSNTELITQYCEVKLIALTPQDRSIPFVGLYSKGIHMHPPVWSEKVPLEIRDELDQLLKWAGSNNYTFSQLRNSPLVKEWLNKWNANSFAGVHHALSNPDRLRAIMYRHRAEAFPLGQDLAAVKIVYSGRLNCPPAQRWIQNVFECEDFFLICCFNQTQASIFKDAKTIILDTSFKRVLGNVSELTVVVKEELGMNTSMVIPIARVFMSTETAISFYFAFTQLFQCLAKANGQPIMFYHIHGYGIQVVVTDMDTKQAAGLGRYLAEFSGNGKDWQWHIQHILIYCLVHYNRGIEQKFSKHPMYQAMRDIPYMEDSEDVMSILEDLKADETTSEWAQHKLTKWILSGLNVNHSLMERGVFLSAHRTTNPVESMHQRSYLDGTRQPLLQAIQSAEAGDQDILDKRQSVLNGHTLTYRNLSPGGALQRSESRRGRIRNTGVDDEPIPFPNIRSTGIPIRGTSSSPEKRQRSESSGALTIAPKRSKTRLTQLAAEGEAQERINQALEQRLLLFERMREAGMEIPAGIERP